MVISLKTEPLEIRDEELGRILCKPWTVGTYREVLGLLKDNQSPDEFVSAFFECVGRAVPDDVPATRESFDAGTPITANQLSALSDEARDRLAAAYLAAEPMVSESSGSQGPDKTGAKPENTLKPRPTELLTSRARNEHTLSSKEIRKVLGSVSLGRGLSDTFLKLNLASDAIRRQLQPLSAMPMDALSNAMKNAEILNRVIPSLSPRMAEIIPSTMINNEIPRLEIPPNPVYQTNKSLAQVQEELSQLVDVAQLQAALIQSLSDTARDTLQQAIQSTGEARAATRIARFSIWVAIIAVVASSVIGVYAIMDGRHTFRTIETAETKFATNQASVERGLRNLIDETRSERVSENKLIDHIDKLVSSHLEASGKGEGSHHR